jgi:outer membrane biosynthesis protein TonB
MIALTNKAIKQHAIDSFLGSSRRRHSWRRSWRAMQPFADQSALLESLAATCASWSQPTQPTAAAQVLTPPELANASSLEAICANLVDVLGVVQPPPPTPACPPNPATPTVQLPKSPPTPPTPPWKKARKSTFIDAPSASAPAASVRPPRFGPVPGETPAEAERRKEKNRLTKTRGGKHKSFFNHRYGKGKGGKGSGDGGGGSSGSSGAQGWG